MDLVLIDPADNKVGGTLNIKNIDEINKAKTVKWTPDNLVFYPDTNSKSLSGFVCLVNLTRQFTNADYLTVLW